MRSWILAAFVVGGLLLVYAGALPLWVWGVMAVLVVFMRVILPRMDPNVDELSVSDESITRQYGAKGQQLSLETVRWDALTRVEVLTRETGLGRLDMLFLLYGEGEAGVAVPGLLAKKYGLVGQLQKRLPGFRDAQLKQARAAKERATFTLWEKVAAPAS